MFRDGPERLLVFGVGTERFAVALSAVQEVVDAPAATPLPDAAASVLGVSTIRGAVVTIYDPRPLLNVDGEVDDAALLFEHGGKRVGLAVHALHDTILVDADELRSAPGVNGSDRSLLGVVRRGADLIAVLDAAALLDVAVSAGEIRGERT